MTKKYIYFFYQVHLVYMNSNNDYRDEEAIRVVNRKRADIPYTNSDAIRTYSIPRGLTRSSPLSRYGAMQTDELQFANSDLLMSTNDYQDLQALTFNRKKLTSPYGKSSNVTMWHCHKMGSAD
jgi:hypothetical protein